jgi:hypothetical protein
MRFVLEESSWAWDGATREEYIERIEQLLDRLDVARERREPFTACRELLKQLIFCDYTLTNLLWDVDSPLDLPSNVSQRIDTLLYDLIYWDDEGEWPETLDVEINGSPVFSPSAALAYTRVQRKQATACVPLPGRWAGPLEVKTQVGTETIHFVVDELSHRRFFRDALDVERVDEKNLAQMAPHAFPDLCFLKSAWGELNSFQGGYRRVKERLLGFFVVLDDHGAWVFKDDTGRLSPKDRIPSDEQKVSVTNQLIQDRFVGWGIRIAPEKPNIYTTPHLRRARERTLKDKTLYCEWHYKVEDHINRVHIHPPHVASSNKVIVAIFADHLPLPGD